MSASHLLTVAATLGLIVGTAPAAQAAAPPPTGQAAPRPADGNPRTVHSTLRTAPLPAVRAAAAALGVSPLLTTPRGGHIPCDMYNAYGLGGISASGSGQTIAIIDADDATPIATDLGGFDSSLGLPDPPSFNVYRPTGAGPAGSGWAQEITLDVEWAHALAPGAAIALVLAKTASTADILPAIDYAVGTLQADVVSMSFGVTEAGDVAGIAAWNTHFPSSNGAGRPVSYLASAGDNYSQVNWPAVAPTVIGVGGTSVAPAAFGGIGVSAHGDCSGSNGLVGVDPANETVWGTGTGPGGNGTGGGISGTVAGPAYQAGSAPSAQRAVPDVAMDADPATGVATFINGAWAAYLSGGTSLSAPMWAGVVARLNQSRAQAGHAALSVTPASSWVYTTPAAAFNDVTVGNSAPLGAADPCLAALTCIARPGYDEVTGRGSPHVSSLAGPSPPSGRQYHSVPPRRIYDSRPSQLGPGQTVTIQVTGGAVPAGAAGAVINVGVTESYGAASGYVLLYPADQARPTASTVNFNQGQTVANLAQVALSAGGAVNVFNAAGYASVFLDLGGYFSASADAAGLYRPLDTPKRILDTRTQIPASNPFRAGGPEQMDLQVTGPAGSGLPPAGAQAVVFNLTEVGGDASSYLAAWPAGSPFPGVSNLNFPPARVLANRVTVPLSADGRVTILNAVGTTNVLVDVAGWYSGGAPGDDTGFKFTPRNPSRLLDTRGPLGGHPGQLGGGQSLTVQGLGSAALAVNVTVLQSSANSFLAAYLALPPDPWASSSDINFQPGDILPNLVVTKVAGDGTFVVYNSVGQADVFVDVAGVYG